MNSTLACSIVAKKLNDPVPHVEAGSRSAKMMMRIGGALKKIADEMPLIFPMHPRTRSNLEKFGIGLGLNITLVGPPAYMAFLDLWKDAAVVLTDSYGLQEQTTAFGVSCITIRENTERTGGVLMCLLELIRHVLLPRLARCCAMMASGEAVRICGWQKGGTY